MCDWPEISAIVCNRVVWKMKRTVAIKRLIVVAPVLALSGCALPKMFTVASYALDGILLLSTGKSTNDHAISVAVGKDCALLRVIKGEDVCREFDTGDGKTTIAVHLAALAAANAAVGIVRVNRLELDLRVP